MIKVVNLSEMKTVSGGLDIDVVDNITVPVIPAVVESLNIDNITIPVVPVIPVVIERLTIDNVSIIGDNCSNVSNS